MKRAIIIPDVHGTDNWRKININDFDKATFVGDYTDGYYNRNYEEEIQNLKDIIEFKKQYPEQVVLLLGNHDINQYLLDEPCSRKAPYKYAQEIKNLFEDNHELFDIAIGLGDYVISHAGFTKTWMKMWKYNSWKDVNDIFHNNKGDYIPFGFNGRDIYGDDITQGPTWVRPRALLSDAFYKKQIVGHTQTKASPLTIKDNGNEAIIIEDPTHNKFFILQYEDQEA